MARGYSIRKRLLYWLGIPIALAGMLTISAAYLFLWHEIDEIYDAQLAHSAKFLLQLAQHDALQDKVLHLGQENANLAHKYETKMGFRIWVDDELLTQSVNAASFDKFEAPPGFSDQQFDRHKWRFFVFIDSEQHIRVEMSERYDIRYELIFQLMLSLLMPGLILIPVILVLVVVGVHRSLQPVVQISSTVDHRNSDDLSPIEAELPEEIAPLVAALNRLFLRIEDSFRREREFTDHAAHELRTPLAAMKTQAQVLLKKAAEPEVAESLQNLLTSIDRANSLIEQLLVLARLESGNTQAQDLFLLDECLRDCVDEIRPLADRKQLVLHLDIAEHVSLRGNEVTVAILLVNLLDNAVKYTPEGGAVTVMLNKQGVLTIADTGHGLSDLEKARAFERFTRFDKTGQRGSGLGLSIVQSIAKLYEISIELADAKPHGLELKLQFPAVKNG